MRNLDEKGIYGQYNQAIEKVKEIILNNRDLVKFLYYRDKNFDIRDIDKFVYSKKIKECVAENQLLEYNSLETREANSYVIIEMGTAGREERNDGINADFVNWRALIYLCSHETICETKNGDRIRCMEQCIQDSFTDADVASTFHTNIGNSQPVSVSDGYKCRVVPIQMVYFNTSRSLNK